MPLGELLSALRKASSDREVLGLVELLEEWRTNTSTADELHQSVERYIGNSWITSGEEHKNVYALWSAFRDECIKGRGGMTMNERLYSFDLFDAWDNAATAEARTLVRLKVDFPTPGKAT
jgi:hypothetical protein